MRKRTQPRVTVNVKDVDAADLNDYHNLNLNTTSFNSSREDFIMTPTSDGTQINEAQRQADPSSFGPTAQGMTSLLMMK